MFSRPAFRKLLRTLVIANLDYLHSRGTHNRVNGLQYVTIKINARKLIEIVKPRYYENYIGFSVSGRKGKDPVYRTIETPQISNNINQLFKKNIK